jgi:queuine tRNA-ribosyltransferase
LGGLHKFMRWDKPILTDSGGFQVMSLSGISKVTEEAVTFASHIDGSKHVLSPERSMEIQADLLGSDIVMQLDECVAWPAEEKRAREGMELSARWGARSKAAFGTRDSQVLFGIQQGSTFENLRGVLAAPAGHRLRRLRHRRPGGGRGAHGDVRGAGLRARPAARRQTALPDGRGQADRPGRGGGAGRRHVRLRAADPLGPPRPGLDLGRRDQHQERQIRRGRHAAGPASDCPASRDYSKAYLRHLFKAEEILGQVLLSWHNIAFFQALTAAMRDAIAEGRFEAFRRDFAARHAGGQ